MGPSKKPTSNAIALAGEFAVLSQLALRGYDANLTLGNTKHVDILVADPSSEHMYRLEVKTTAYHTAWGDAVKRSKIWGNHYAWIMGQKHEDLTSDSLFYCFVNIAGTDADTFRFFVLPSNVVASYVKAQHQHWLELDKGRNDTAMRTFRLAVGDPASYPLPTPRADEYENDWSFNN